MRKPVIILLLLALLTTGCLGGGPRQVGPVPEGSVEDYELEWEEVNESISIYLAPSGPVNVVHQVSNITEYRLDLNQGELSKKGAVDIASISSLVLITSNDSTPAHHSELRQNEFKVKMEEPFTGIIAYQARMALTSERWLPTKHFQWATNHPTEQVKVVLPPNYYADDLLLGAPYPPVTNTSSLSDGRTVLIWNDVPKGAFLQVTYYPGWIPTVMRYLFLGTAAALILAALYRNLVLRELQKEK